MANFTDNYNLILPEQEDYYDVQEFNDNMELLDSAVGELAMEVEEVNPKLDSLDDKLTALDNKIGKSTDVAPNTIYGLLKAGGQLVKSIQRHGYSNGASSFSGVVNISAVDSDKCIVLVERTYNGSDSLLQYDYALSDTSITVSHPGYTSAGILRLAFTVVEFY